MFETDVETEVDRGDAGVADAVRFRVTVRNRGDEPATLSFRSSQRVEVTAWPVDGDGDDADPAWRASADRMHAQLLDTETVGPGDARTYDATWESPPTGRYRVDGAVVAADRDLTATTTLSV